MLELQDFCSEVAIGYRKRFEKHGTSCLRFSIMMEFRGITIMQSMPSKQLHNCEMSLEEKIRPRE